MEGRSDTALRGERFGRFRPKLFSTLFESRSLFGNVRHGPSRLRFDGCRGLKRGSGGAVPWIGRARTAVFCRCKACGFAFGFAGLRGRWRGGVRQFLGKNGRGTGSLIHKIFLKYNGSQVDGLDRFGLNREIGPISLFQLFAANDYFGVEIMVPFQRFGTQSF